MTRSGALLLILLVFGAATPLHAARFPITLASVAAALAAQEPALNADSLQVPTVTSARPNPQLLVQAVAPRGSSAEIRLACAAPQECLPFLVTVHGVSLSPATPAPQGSAAAAHLTKTAGPPALRAGAHAVLRIDSGHLHITMPVIALSAGAPGDQIRVSSEDHRLHYLARVISANLLEGSL